MSTDLVALGEFAVLLLGCVFGFLSGALWMSRLRLQDIRAHQKWVEDYTTLVAKLLDDTAAAYLSKRDGGE